MLPPFTSFIGQYVKNMIYTLKKVSLLSQQLNKSFLLRPSGFDQK